MKRVSSILLLLLVISIVSSSAALAQPEARGFGFGGAMGMGFFPDMTGINAFMSEYGLPSMGSFLVGAGGNGRGGVIGDLVFGGVGWGLMAFSENDQLQADFVSAGGGFDLGAAIGGDEDSVLTLGIVLGAGANVLTLSDTFATVDDDDEVSTCGIVPMPTSQEWVQVTGFVQPYVSMAAQLFPWLAFEFRLGYIFPIVGVDVSELVGIPAPSLELAGPTVSFGLVFGGIGSSAAEREARRIDDVDRLAEEVAGKQMVTAVSEGSFTLEPGTELMIENGFGDIVISSYPVDTTGGPADLIVEWQAARTAKEKHISELQATVEGVDTGTLLSATGAGKVDYVLRIPSGVDLKVKNGAGDVTLVGHEAQTIIIENGVGGIHLQSLDAIALLVSGGVCEIQLSDLKAQTLLVDLVLGEINVDLPIDTSARLLAKAKIGNVDLDRFPGMTGGVHGFLGRTANATLGLGETMIELNVGLGNIDISMP